LEKSGGRGEVRYRVIEVSKFLVSGIRGKGMAKTNKEKGKRARLGCKSKGGK